MWDIFVFSFLVALSGALSPGPLLTFTIYKSLNKKRGYLAGIYIVMGHATIEFLLIIALLAGASLFFQNVIVIIIIGIVGGILLALFGFLVIRDALNTEIDELFNSSENKLKGIKGNSYLGGIIASLTNPYWTLWWSVVGLGFMLNFNITFANPLGILMFFLGHELGDIIWYLPISVFVYLGRKALNYKIYRYALFICGAFMIVFGIYLILNITFSPPQF